MHFHRCTMPHEMLRPAFGALGAPHSNCLHTHSVPLSHQNKQHWRTNVQIQTVQTCKLQLKLNLHAEHYHLSKLSCLHIHQQKRFYPWRIEGRPMTRLTSTTSTTTTCTRRTICNVFNSTFIDSVHWSCSISTNHSFTATKRYLIVVFASSACAGYTTISMCWIHNHKTERNKLLSHSEAGGPTLIYRASLNKAANGQDGVVTQCTVGCMNWHLQTFRCVTHKLTVLTHNKLTVLTHNKLTVLTHNKLTVLTQQTNCTDT
jgi:hypothetical protein